MGWRRDEMKMDRFVIDRNHSPLQLLPRTRAGRITVALLGALAIAIADGLIGGEVKMYPFYFLPVTYAAMTTDAKASLVMVLLCSALELASNLLGGVVYGAGWIWVWNTAAHGLALALIAVLIVRLRAALQKESESARIDSLTGLMNRRAFNELAPALLGLCRREDNPVVMAYVDLDNFKCVNDTGGHQQGDVVLRRVAQALRSRLRETDLLARIGGDEFALLLFDADVQKAGEILEHMRADIEASMRSLGHAVTASMGAAAYRHAPTGMRELEHAADMTMYGVKKTGKNCVKVMAYDQTASPPQTHWDASG